MSLPLTVSPFPFSPPPAVSQVTFFSSIHEIIYISQWFPFELHPSPLEFEHLSSISWHIPLLISQLLPGETFFPWGLPLWRSSRGTGKAGLACEGAAPPPAPQPHTFPDTRPTEGLEPTRPQRLTPTKVSRAPVETRVSRNSSFCGADDV